MKDLEWLKEVMLEAKVELLAKKEFGGYQHGYMDALTLFEDAVDDVDQVEQPEITIEQAMNKLAEKYPFSSASIVAILEGHAQQGRYEQPELPVIPEFVAEDYEVLQAYGGVDLAAMNYWTRNSALQCTEKSYKWLLDQDMETITNLLRGRFTVEEKKYYVKDNRRRPLLLKEIETGEIKEVSEITNADNPIGESHDVLLTEQEIKGFDERYFAFAKEIN